MPNFTEHTHGNTRYIEHVVTTQGRDKYIFEVASGSLLSISVYSEQRIDVLRVAFTGIEGGLGVIREEDVGKDDPREKRGSVFYETGLDVRDDNPAPRHSNIHSAGLAYGDRHEHFAIRQAFRNDSPMATIGRLARLLGTATCLEVLHLLEQTRV